MTEPAKRIFFVLTSSNMSSQLKMLHSYAENIVGVRLRGACVMKQRNRYFMNLL